MRRLAVFASCFSIAVFLSNYIIPSGCAVYCAALSAGVTVAFIFVKSVFKYKKHIIIGLLALSLGFVVFDAHYRRTGLVAEELNNYKGQAYAEVTAYPIISDDYTSIEAKIYTEDTKALNAKLYDYNHALDELKPGQIVSLNVSLRAANTRYGEEDAYYNSRDIYIIGNSKGDVKAFEDRGFYINALPSYIGHAISGMIEKIFPSDTIAFMKALLIGDRTDFYKDIALSTDFSISGFMHIVAVSGMHISFLVGFLMIAFGKSAQSSIISIIIVWLFAFSSGGSPSVIRASFMQTMVLLAPIFRREADEITSLTAALMIILLFNPYSAASLSLQLSFAAVAGLILFGEKIHDTLLNVFKVKNAHAPLGYLLGVISSSCAVMVFTLPLIAVYFDYIQLLGVLTNLLALWAVSLCFGFGQIACMFGFALRPVGKLIAYVVSYLACYIFAVVEFIADIPFAVIYLPRMLMVLWLAVLYFGFISILHTKVKAYLKLILPTASGALLLIIMLIAVKTYYNSGEAIYTALNVGQGQSIAAFSKGETVLVDCGGKGRSENAGKTAANYIKSCGKDKIDALIITHAHDDHANGVLQLFELIEVEKIFMPDKWEDNSLYDDIVKSAVRHGTEVNILTNDVHYSMAQFEIDFFAPVSGSKDNEDSLMLMLSRGKYNMLITGDSSAKRERALLSEYGIKNVESIIVGHHGSKYSTSEELLSAIGARNAIISVGFNSYGHPSEEVIDRLEQYEYNTFRTDKNGNIQIWIDEKWQERVKTSQK